MKYIFPLLVLFIIYLSGCQSGKNKNNSTSRALDSSEFTQVDIKYAQGFSVADYGNYKLVDIHDPAEESDIIYHYALVKRGEKTNSIPSKYTIIETPIDNIICMTSLQLSNFIKLDALDKVKGITSTRFLHNSKINEQLKNGLTKKIGIEGNFDTELIIAINPDVILVSPFKKGGYETMRNLDIPLISFLGYKEISPLGQAEWIKFTAMLLGMEEEGEKQFKTIEERYNELKEATKEVSYRPTVLSGEMNSGNWYVLGGNSHLAQLVRDAGGEYFKSDDKETGGWYVDFETAYSQGANADYWRMVNSYNGEFSYEALRQSDARYADFKAFQKKKVIYCNLREKPFYENTPVEPEVVLADLIKIFHPELLSEHTPVYYELLK